MLLGAYGQGMQRTPQVGGPHSPRLGLLSTFSACFSCQFLRLIPWFITPLPAARVQSPPRTVPAMFP